MSVPLVLTGVVGPSIAGSVTKSILTNESLAKLGIGAKNVLHKAAVNSLAGQAVTAIASGIKKKQKSFEEAGGIKEFLASKTPFQEIMTSDGTTIKVLRTQAKQIEKWDDRRRDAFIKYHYETSEQHKRQVSEIKQKISQNVNEKVTSVKNIGGKINEGIYNARVGLANFIDPSKQPQPQPVSATVNNDPPTPPMPVSKAVAPSNIKSSLYPGGKTEKLQEIREPVVSRSTLENPLDKMDFSISSSFQDVPARI